LEHKRRRPFARDRLCQRICAVWGITVSPFKAFCKGRRCQQHEAEQFAEEDRVCVVGTGSTRFALIVWKPEMIFEKRVIAFAARSFFAATEIRGHARRFHRS
jgi:hypothetical protein